MNEVNGIQQILSPPMPSMKIGDIPEISGKGEKSFSQLLSESIAKVDEFGQEASKLQIDLALGRPVELHEVMLASTKAGIAMELLIELRNKLIEAYQEISRMPV